PYPKRTQSDSSQRQTGQKRQRKTAPNAKQSSVLNKKTKTAKQNNAYVRKKDSVTDMRDELERRARASADKFIDAKMLFYLLLSTISMPNDDNIKVPSVRFQLRWTDTKYQTREHVHDIVENVLARVICQFAKMQKNKLRVGESWTSLCTMAPNFSNLPALTEEFKEVEELEYREWATFRGQRGLQIPDKLHDSRSYRSHDFFFKPLK
ncbi:hypothetical protein GN958_ATG19492, partial [Phytophthora infestans]